MMSNLFINYRLLIASLHTRCNCDIIMSMKEVIIMPIIIPIKDLRKTSELSDLAHKEQEPIFVTKNGYSDLVVMSTELYDSIIRTNRIDQAIYEAEQEVEDGAEPVDAIEVFSGLEKKYFG